jgi:ATP-binding cassette subfamily B protein
VLARGTHEELLAEVPGYAALVRAYSQAAEVEPVGGMA